MGIYKPLCRNFVFTPLDNLSYGDLYGFSSIKYFKEKTNLLNDLQRETDNMEETEIITIGDSFFYTVTGNKNFTEVLEKKIKQPVFIVQNIFAVNFPFEYLKSIKYQKTAKPKFLILETVERLSIMRNRTYNIIDEKLSHLNPETLKTKDNSINDIKYFFLNNKISRPEISLIKNLRFKLTGDMDPAIGSYSFNPPNLFVRDDLEFIKQTKTKELMEDFINSIHKLSIKLKNDYNIILIYLVIPNKYSLYHETAKIDIGYDNFVPVLNEQLRKIKVWTIDMYFPFKNFIKKYPYIPLYFKSDTHYNSKGKEILADLVSRELIKIRKELNLASFVPVKPIHKEIKTSVKAEFDEQTYLKAFPDVADAVRAGAFFRGYEHYLRFGKKEKRLELPEYNKAKEELH